MRRKSHISTAIAVCLAALSNTTITLAAELAAAPPARELSEYERDSISTALERVGGQVEPAPEGKIVESIEVVTLDVIEPRDPAPDLLNILHATTQKPIIEREVLLRVNRPFRQLLADETARILRAKPQLSVVLVVPLRGSDAFHVRVLVVTKDVWSLRVGWDLAFYNGHVTSLVLQPSETNLFGTNQTIAADLTLAPNNYTLGLTYLAPRLAGSHVSASISGNLTMSCANGAAEGGSGTFYYGQPLYSSDADWSWGTAVSFSNSVVRAPDEKSAICSNPREALTYLKLAEPVSDGSNVQYVGLPNRYRYEGLRGQLVVTRSLNTANKINLSFGAELDHHTYATLPTTDAEVNTYRRNDQDRLAAEESQVGRALGLAQWQARQDAKRDTRVSPYAQLHAYSNRFLSTINYATLGLQEDVQLGHDLYLRLYPAFRPLSSRDLLGLFTSAAYTIPIRTGFFRALAAGTFELAASEKNREGDRVSDVAQSKSRIQISGYVASPEIGFGRFLSGVTVLRRALHYQDDRLVYLGSSGMLRGYKPSALSGNDLIVSNSEFRTRPVQLFSILAGLDLFYDIGDAPARLSQFKLRQGGGAGVRVVLPQLNRDVFRVDFGFPLQNDPTGEFTITAGFKQVFGAPSARPDVLLPQ